MPLEVELARILTIDIVVVELASTIPRHLEVKLASTVPPHLEVELARTLTIDAHPVLFISGFEPLIALLFEFKCQLFAARLDDTAIEHDMYKVRREVVQHALGVSNHQDAQVGACQGVDAL